MARPNLPSTRPRLERLVDRDVPSTLSFLAHGEVAYTAREGTANNLTISYSADKAGYLLTDTTETIQVDRAAAAAGVTGGGTNSVRIPARIVGRLTFALGDRNDAVQVLSTIHTTTIATGAGNDTITVGGDTGLRDVIARITVDGGGVDGPVAPQPGLPAAPEFDVLRVVEAANTGDRTFSVTGTAVEFGGAKVSYEDVDQVSVSGGNGADTFTVLGTAASTGVTIAGGGGRDTFAVGDPATGLNNLLGGLTIALGPAGDAPVADQLVVNDAAATGGQVYEVSATGVRRPGSRVAAINTPDSRFLDVTLTAGGGDDQVQVRDLRSFHTVTVNAGGGSDDIDLTVTQAGGSLQVNGGDAGEAGDTFTFRDDSPADAAHTYSVSGDAVALSVAQGSSGPSLPPPPTTVNYGGVEHLQIIGSEGADEYRLDAQPAGREVSIDARGGGDVFVVNDAAFLTQGAAVALAGGAGRDWLDYRAVSSRVVVDLLTGLATGLTGGVSGVEHVHGGTAADLLSGDDARNILIGGAGDDVLIGLGGRDLLVGGHGGNSLLGGEGEDLLIAVRFDYEDEPATLQSILTTWEQDVPQAQRRQQLAGLINLVTIESDGFADFMDGGPGDDWEFTEF